FLGMRTGVVVACLIPATIVTSLLLMSTVGLGLNQVSLAALIMALGMLVDNAIVMAESIMVKMGKGEKAYDAAISSAAELRIPLLISSLTTSAAFLPFYLAQSTMGEIVGSIFVVITFSLLSSWVFALTLIPLLGIYFIRVKAPGENALSLFDRFGDVYVRILKFNLRRPWTLMGGIALVFGLSLYGMGFVPKIFMPDSDRALVTANFELPIGTDIKRTEAVIDGVNTYLNEHFLVTEERLEGVVDFTAYIGEGAPKYDLGYTAPEQTSYTAHVLINTTSNRVNDAVIQGLEDYCYNHYPELTPTIGRLSTGGGNAQAVQVRISGKNPQHLFELSEAVKEKLRR
ncbi:MAG: efflux RND transporter permease subunit, partial [Desulfovibrionales bacterium]|nr:efflux RND transporter permease subunit [Desulfovibrionales bacterium]